LYRSLSILEEKKTQNLINNYFFIFAIILLKNPVILKKISKILLKNQDIYWENFRFFMFHLKNYLKKLFSNWKNFEN